LSKPIKIKEINNKTQETMVKENIYQFKVVDISGNMISILPLKGKKSDDCKYSIQMWFNTSIRGLEAIYKQYKDDNFVIIGFPANNFASQEPGTNKEIATFVN
jgi:glutathione peroxidase